tara:strand:- start:518 stop:1141 length:624 start_codon:yes stop_codon:yes gene_type:complete
MRSYSKERQDLFAHYVLDKESGPKYFLDVGCHHPFDDNNTKALEDAGWKGLLFDIRQEWVDLCSDYRKNSVILMDVSKPEFVEAITDNFKDTVIDYISLDVDNGTLEALENLISGNVQFKCMTLEHDSYQAGPDIRDASREILKKEGYFLLFEDVLTDRTDLAGWQPWEDWWVNPQHVDNSILVKADKNITYTNAVQKVMEFSYERE